MAMHSNPWRRFLGDSTSPDPAERELFVRQVGRMRATVDLELGSRFSHDDKNKVLEEVLSDLAAGKLEELSAEHASEEAFQMALHVLLLKRCQHLMLDRYRAQLEPLLATDEEVAAG